MGRFLAYQRKSALLLICIIFCDQHAFGQKIPDFQFRVLHESGSSWADEIAQSLVESVKESRGLRSMEKGTPENRLRCALLSGMLAYNYGPSVFNRIKDYAGRFAHSLNGDNVWNHFWGNMLCGEQSSVASATSHETSGSEAQSGSISGGSSGAGLEGNGGSASGGLSSVGGSMGGSTGGGSESVSGQLGNGETGHGQGSGSQWSSGTQGSDGQGGGLWMIHHQEANAGGSTSSHLGSGGTASGTTGNNWGLSGGSSGNSGGSAGSSTGTSAAAASGSSASGGLLGHLWGHGSAEKHHGFMSSFCQNLGKNGASSHPTCNEEGKQKLGIPC